MVFWRRYVRVPRACSGGERAHQVTSHVRHERYLAVFLENEARGSETGVRARLRAQSLLKSINTSVDPCDDFFSYVCDGWIKDHPIPDTDSSFGTFEQTEENMKNELKRIIENVTNFDQPQNLMEMAATMYQACICEYYEEEQLIPMVKDLLREWGFPLWPAMRPTEVPYRNYTELLEATSLWPFFSVNVGQDLNDTNRFIIQLDEAPLPILGRQTLLNPNASDFNRRIVDAYLFLITTAVIVLNPNATEYDAGSIAERIFVLEARLASMTEDPDERRDINALYQKISIGDLMKQVPNIPTLACLNRTFSLANITLNETEEVAIFGMSYIKKANDFFGCIYDLTDMYNLAGWRRIFKLLLLTSKTFSKAWQNLLQIAYGVRKEKPHWEYCLAKVTSAMPFVVGRMYVEKNFNVSAKNDLDNLPYGGKCLLQPHDKRNGSVNYGAIGTVIGHEMTHGFDNQGKKFDEDGRLRNWWSNSTQKKFDAKSKCFIDQYSAVFSELANRTLNGVNTLGENIADNGGLRMAFRTLNEQLKAFETPDVRLPGLENYTSKHLFFLSTAYVWCGSSRAGALRLQIEYDPHSPRRQR
ncbi:hypothetical protein HPB51_006279 [Rhipicephalus microplus]|uniref:M13 family peptidase n=1 Tax=Rhipicephalus microplus TaxID=6941 RepID=A0A9J6ELX9_RHIMP|nr:hypothetical protein HPB51_006279 [Rhipicephalus microplus]